MAKISKMPVLGPNTKILSFDLETNGLHGEAFAVGGVVMSADGTVVSEFSARCRLTRKVDDWVKDNVLPAIADMDITHATYVEMREAFWQWYLENEPEADYVLVNNGYPVEYRFLLDCQDASIEERYWQHPFPILELNSILLMTNHDNATSKRKLKESLDADHWRKMHHPVEDTKMAIKLAFEAFRISNKL